MQDTKPFYNKTFGILSCIGITCVVMGHVGCELMLHELIDYYSFHMPLFAFISGYFYYPQLENKIGSYILKKSKNLLLPMYLAALFYLLVQTALHYLGFTIGNTFSIYNWLIYPWFNAQYSGFVAPCWFLLALFLVSVFNALLRKLLFSLFKPLNGLTIDIISGTVYFLLFVLVFYYTNTYEPEGIALILERSAFLLFYYFVGWCYKQYFEKYDEKIPDLFAILMIIAIRIVLQHFYGRCNFRTYISDFGELWYVNLISSLSGIAFWLRAAKMISPVVKDDGVILYIGKHTREIMTHHLFAIFVIQSFMAVANKFFGLFAGFNRAYYMATEYYFYTPLEIDRLFYALSSIALVSAFCKMKENKVQKLTSQKE